MKKLIHRASNILLKEKSITLILGALVAALLSYPFHSLQVESSIGYHDYITAKRAHQDFVEMYQRSPDNLDFLPVEISEKIGTPGFPIMLNRSSGEISYRLDTPRSYGQSNLIDLFFGRNVIVGLSIGHVNISN